MQSFDLGRLQTLPLPISVSAGISGGWGMDGGVHGGMSGEDLPLLQGCHRKGGWQRGGLLDCNSVQKFLTSSLHRPP